MRLVDAGRPHVLEASDAPMPQPGPGELLIEVHAAGVMPTEVGWYPTWHDKTGGQRSGPVPSHEFSGVIAGVGEGVGALEVGLEIYGMNDWFADGAIAEYCIAQYESVAPKPTTLTHVEAATVPISALTSWQALFGHAQLQSGERVLVHGGAGGVGSFAIQLAKMHGAHVITTVSERNLDFVAELGADEAVDYRATRFEERIAPVDVVLDTVGGETFVRSWDVLKPAGRMVSVASSAEKTTDPRLKQAFFIVEPNQRQLGSIARYFEEGRLRTVVDAVVPFNEAPNAYAGNIERHGRGKAVVSVAA